MIILLVVAIVATVLLGIYADKEISDGAEFGAWCSGVIAFVIMVCLICVCIDAKENKALIQAHLDNPTNYTYSQLAEHNEFVTKNKVWQGTIFSFYNDTDLQVIDIDNVSQKVIIDSKDK
ncbi:MAG: hypothetical protein VZQ58_06510 [Bacteroidales bacterium]|nr:hypothetical protein [Bacteroidales bacterium]